MGRSRVSWGSGFNEDFGFRVSWGGSRWGLGFGGFVRLELLCRVSEVFRVFVQGFGFRV